ncbi:MAG: LuxR C-terminal-related transcriptional regulator [Thermomicrobiales bacterium]
MMWSDWTVAIPAWALALPRLNATLDEAIASQHHRLTLIMAPTGYGKTMLLKQWMASSDAARQTSAVITPRRPGDGSRPVVRHLRGDPSFAEIVGNLVDDGSPTGSGVSRDRARDALFEAVVHTGPPCVLVIDDLDLLPVMTRRFLIDGLLGHPDSPAGLHIVAAGRMPARHFLGRLAAAGQVRQLFARDLALTPPEASELLRRRGVPDPVDRRLEAVMKLTGGWPAGIALAGHVIDEDEEPGQWLPLDDHVATAVLDRLDDPTRQMLIAAAHLPWIDRELWQTLAQGRQGQVASFDTVRSIVPMTLVDHRTDGRRAHCLVPLLRASLQRLRISAEIDGGPDDTGPILNSAMAWFADNALHGDVIALAQETGRWPEALATLHPHCAELASRDDHRPIIALLSRLPEPQLLCNDDLAFWYMLSLLSVGDISEGTRLYPLLMKAWQGRTDALTQGRSLVLGTLLAIWQGDRELALARAQDALAILPAEASHERMRAAASGEVLSWHLGQRETAISMLAIARSACERLPWDQRWWATFVLPNQADRTALEGHLTAAANQFQHLIDSYSAVFPDQMALMHMRLALIELERGDAAAAGRTMDLIGPVPPVGYWMQEVPLARAKILHALGHDHEAKETLYSALREASSDLNEIDVRRTRTVLAQLWLDSGEVALADAWATEETLSMDIWPRSFGQTVPGTVMAQLHLTHGRHPEAIALLDALVDEGTRREQPAPLVHVHAVRALALALARDVDAAQEAIRTALAIGQPNGFQRSYLVGNLDTRLLLGTPEQTLGLAATFLSPRTSANGVTLSARELDVLLLAMQGMTNADIATQLFISPMTVKNHLARIYQRLGVRNRNEAVIAARSRGLIE